MRAAPVRRAYPKRGLHLWLSPPDSPLLDPRSVGGRSRFCVEGSAAMLGDRVNPSVPSLRPPYC